MGCNFYFVILLVNFGAVLAISWFFLNQLKKEYSIYRFFSKNELGRKLLARDPICFHISVVYLMAVMMRSSEEVEFDKLSIIVRYILQIIPREKQAEAFKALDYMTKRVDGTGQYKKIYSIIDVDALSRGDTDKCFNGDYILSRYLNELDGTRLAEEIARYIDEVDRRYLMFLLFRLVIADGVVSDEPKDNCKSELRLLKMICIEGLHIKREELMAMYSAWQNNSLDEWYKSQIAPYNHGLYADSEGFADIFYSTCSFSQIGTDIELLKSSDSFVWIKVLLLILPSLTILIIFLLSFLENQLMVHHYPISLGVMFVVFAISTIVVNWKKYDLDLYSVSTILRTSCENKMHRNRLILFSVLGVGTIISFYFNAMNVFYLSVNKEFNCGEITKVSRVWAINRVFSKSGAVAHYQVELHPVGVDDTDLINIKKPQLSFLNQVCADALPYLSAARFLNNNGKCHKKYSVKCSVEKYNELDLYRASEKQRYISVNFKVGYYGLVYYGGYKIMDEDYEPNDSKGLQ